MPNIISGSDVLGAMDQLGWLDDEIGLPRTSIRRERRQRRRGGGSGRGGGAVPSGGRRRTGSAALAERAADRSNFGMPMTLGTDLLASSQRMQPFGVGQVTLTDALSAADLQAIAQKPMQPMALIVNAIYRPATGAAMDGAFLVTVDEIKLGTSSQLAGVGPIPAAYFRPDTVQSRLALSPIGPGVTVQIQVSTPPLAAGDTLIVGASMLCVVAEQ